MQIKKILFIRRDNIGDLICTTPAIHAVRERFPDARIGVLVSTYNADVIINNPDIDEVYIYEKAKHAQDKNRLSVWWNNLKVFRKIRREQYDIAVGCGTYYSPRLARYTALTGAKRRVGYVPRGVRKSLWYNAPVLEPEQPAHEVETVFHLLSVLGIHGPIPPMRVFPVEAEVRKTRDFLTAVGIRRDKPLIAFHISSRRQQNRWPIEKFVELARGILSRKEAEIMLLWSPGSEKNVLYPGDDEKAELFMRSVQPGAAAYRTSTVRGLIAAISLSDLVVCGDGGAMHIAAALEKRIVTIWGTSGPIRWRPWGVTHLILQDKSRRAENISVESAFEAVQRLLI